MKGGIVALGLIMMFVGLAWIPITLLLFPLICISAVEVGCWLFLFSPAFIVVGILIFIAGLVARRRDETVVRYPVPV